MARYLSSSTPLTNSATPAVLGTIVPEAGDNIVGIVYSDQSGTLNIDQSADGGANWDATTAVAVTGAAAPFGGQTFSVPVYGNAIQFRYTNPTTPQTAFRLRARLSSSGPRA
jgi:hypothetical protein